MSHRFYKKLIISSMLLATIPFHNVSAHTTDFNLSYLYFGSSENYVNVVDQAKGNIKTVSPSYFNLNSDGTLQISPNTNRNFIESMHKKGIKVVPFLSNHWDREQGKLALKNGGKLSSDIAAAIEKYNLDGINVDIENVTEVERNQYTNFVKMLRNKLPKTKEVSVAVAANPNGWTKGWHGSYDYKNLSKYADYLILMAYDESYGGSPEGPVASIDWVERSIKYTLNQGVPNEKLALGIPFYGRYWIKGNSYGGDGISDKQISHLVSKYNGTITVDPTSMSAKAVVTIKQGDSTKLDGKTFGPGTYHIWFENDVTMKAKIGLVHKYNLKGTANWSLGQEDKTIWNHYEEWLSNHDLDGIPTDFEEGIFIDTWSNWAKNEIQSVYQKGWMLGKTENVFGVNESLTRAQAAVIFVRALDLKPLTPVQTSSFKDVSDKYWAMSEIEIAKQHGIINGSTNGQFNPTQPLPRDQMAVILDRIINKNPVVSKTQISSPYPDVPDNYWAIDAMVRLKNQEIFSGYGNGHFGPKDVITRAQMAVLLNRISPIIAPEEPGDHDNADGDTDESNHQTSDSFIEYSIVSGDTLSKVATKFDTTVSAIKQFNQLTSDLIFAGQTLKIPTQNHEEQSDVPEEENSVIPEDTPKGNLNTLLEDSLNYLGVPYVSGGVTPNGFDCSGFIYYMYTKHGYQMERTSSQNLFTMGKSVDKPNLFPGDLVFFAIDKPDTISHVGFYLGDGKFISATTGKGIWTYSIDDAYWSKYYVGAKRIY